MNKIHSLLFLITVSFLISCSDDDEGLMCSTQYVFGITLNLHDAVSGEPVSRCETSYRVVDGEYVEEDDNFPSDSCENSTSIYAAGEREGIYDITVSKIGYETWESNNVIVNDDVCHVDPVTIDAFLVPQG